MSTTSDGSVSRLIDGLVVGDEAVVEQLWKRYFHRLVALARKRLRDAPPLVDNEEDVALSAFASFYRNAKQGKFPNLLDRDGLWRLLVVITVRKAAHLRRDQGRRQPGNGKVVETEATNPLVLEELLSRELSPAFAALAVEEHRRLLNCLGNPELVSVASMRMEAYTVEEIAARLGYSLRAIKRKLELIRATWEKELLAREGFRRGRRFIRGRRPSTGEEHATGEP